MKWTIEAILRIFTMEFFNNSNKVSALFLRKNQILQNKFLISNLCISVLVYINFLNLNASLT
ncbi:hypothetical protein B1J93_16150 [Leptospira kirschneri serovar Pomona]|uniref:Uncharacterized protein n=1 Tax=Leptospira kirschneri serovar Pomona TaxID=561005 RepID=A0A1T1DIC1_9LEPT|nr:hypothetical protein B1J93_16150 [Leptospira kirschneri serovar Pomona]